MKTSKNITLIDGQFSVEEAKEILLNVFSSKLQFHQMKNFSNYERFGTKDENGRRRIDELKESITLIKNTLEDAKNAGFELVLKSNVSIELVKSDKNQLINQA